MSVQMELDGLGVSHAEQRTYDVLLHHPDSTIAELATLTRLGGTSLRRLLRSLEDKGMLTRTASRPTRFAPTPPEIAIEILALRQQERIHRARLAGIVMASRTRGAGRAVGEADIEVVRGAAAGAARFRQIQRLARREILILDRPPYITQPHAAQHQLQRELQSRGVRYRTIYDRDMLGDIGQFEGLRELAACGEQARVLTGVPMKLVLADRRIALIPYDLSANVRIVLLTLPALMDGLLALFETLWVRAAPLWPGDSGHLRPSAEHQQLLAMLAAGLTDKTIARKLDVTQRTVERRVRRAMDELGARTRFQLGLQAAIHGLLSDGAPEDATRHRAPRA